MEMCYNGALAMPSSYVVMSEEEMTYTKGGDNVYRMPISNAKSYLFGVIGMAVAFAGACAAIPQVALQIIGSCYYSHLASSAMGCVNQCNEWLKKYNSSRTVRVTEYTISGVITGYSVNL